jgi:glutathionylspermidine synthase
MRFAPFALPAPALEARLARLRWDFRKWDTHVRGRETVARGALVLSRREHEDAVRVAEDLFALTGTALASWPDDPETTRLLGVDPALVPLARGGGPRVTRVDLFLTEDGWRASECNDDVPGGYNDALGLAALFHDAVEKGAEPPGDLPDALVRILSSGARRVGLVYATAYAEDLQVVRLLADLLEAHGVPTVLASPAHLAHPEQDGPTRLAGEEVDAIFRFFPAEWYPALPNLADWERAVRAGLRVVNPFATAWTQSKAAFSLLRHPAIPLTRPLTPERAREALGERERWVLKPCFGRMGEGVVLGASETARGWEKALAGALRSPSPSVLQERFRPIPFELEPGRSATACVGAYVVDGRFAGYYSRLSDRHVVRFDAANVLTVLEAL